ncbi:heparin lyase I family protein [Gephyromycinifex aptenodytis]|uniref:heparin lyase I family protein n=1 Tax=Gephyromycinifex aptenodytis TaxID=2716227 RepID=UPI001445740F|nr:heparin lyase I family protein [Gephyromycinifex aptenodytis]
MGLRAVGSVVASILLATVLGGAAVAAEPEWKFDRPGSRWVLTDASGKVVQQRPVERPAAGRTHALGGGREPVVSANGRVWDFVIPATSPVPSGSRRSEVWWARGGEHVGVTQGQTMLWGADVSGRLGAAASQSGQWHVLSQWIGTTGGRWIGPTVALTVADGQLRLSGGNGFTDRRRHWQVDLAPWRDGRNYQVQLQLRFAAGGQGWVSAWVDGQQVVNRWTPTTRTGEVVGTWYPGSSTVWARSGLYRGTSGQPGPTYEQRIRLVDVAMG